MKTIFIALGLLLLVLALLLAPGFNIDIQVSKHPAQAPSGDPAPAARR